MKAAQSAETEIEKLARISTDIAREEITGFYAALMQIALSLESGDLEKARQAVGLSIGKIAGIYGLIYLEAPPWCPPSLRPKLSKGVAALRKHIGDINQVRLHEKRQQLEREAGSPPPRAN
jgi:hypothetical protein